MEGSGGQPRLKRKSAQQNRGDCFSEAMAEMQTVQTEMQAVQTALQTDLLDERRQINVNLVIHGQVCRGGVAGINPRGASRPSCHDQVF